MESGKIKPWTGIANHKWKVEQYLASLGDFPYVVLRPATVYGVGDSQGISNKTLSCCILILTYSRTDVCRILSAATDCSGCLSAAERGYETIVDKRSLY